MLRKTCATPLLVIIFSAVILLGIDEHFGHSHLRNGLRDMAVKQQNWYEKSGLFSKSYKLISIAFNVLSSHLFTAAHKFSIVQSSAAGHQLTPCFSRSGVFDFTSLTDKMSSFQCTLQFGEQVKVTGAISSELGRGCASSSTGMHLLAKTCFTANAL
jgi:hypothetical protein